ncbi:glycosyltransferase family 39 protein [Streptomyces sp. XY006]|uniref:glycosyltransferase family 39 protein n=1 Tax=Streptomyces sp. XY006 TaxID=2021410 RepID=UPI00211ACE9D|nr:glycosyltransferase family 39 protein [Streptomyces sp. XY006]
MEAAITQHRDATGTIPGPRRPHPSSPRPEPPAGRWRQAAPIASPALAALALGLWGIERQGSMWRDESVTYQVAHRPLGELWGLLGEIDAVHGLYYLLMHAVFAVWDGGLVALRLPSVLGMALAAAGVGAIGARLSGHRAGLLAGLVFAVLPIVQQYAQEGRSYALVTAGVTWSTYFFLRATAGSGRRWWTAYAVALAVACWLHEFAAPALVAHGVTLWWSGAGRREVRRWAVAVAAVVLSLLPLAVISVGQAEAQLGWLGRPKAGAWLLFAGLSVPSALLCRLLVTVRHPGAAALTRLALPLLIAPAGLLMTISLVRPWYVDRYVLYGMTGLALPAGAALAWAIGRRHRLVPPLRLVTECVAATLAVAVLLPWSSRVRSPESRKDDVVAVARTVERSARPGDGVLFMPSRRREWLLPYPEVYDRLHDLALARPPEQSDTLHGTELTPSALRRTILASDRLIALQDPAGQPRDPFPGEKLKRRVLREYFTECERVRVHGAQVVVYVRRGVSTC